MGKITESFDEALDKFKNHLIQCGHPPSIRWCFEEDTIHLLKYRFFKIQNYNEEYIRKLYNLSTQSPIGVIIECMGSDKKYSFCRLWFPETYDDLEPGELCDGLTLKAIKQDYRIIKSYSNPIIWRLVRIFQGRKEAKADKQIFSKKILY